MDGVKSIFASKTFWGAAIALVAALAPSFGLAFTVEDGNQLLALFDEGMAVFGSLLAIYGRVTATKKIGTA